MAYYQHPVDVTSLPAWQALSQHREGMQTFSLRHAFQQDSQRFQRFSLSGCGLFLDYSKNLIDESTRQLLVQLAPTAARPSSDVRLSLQGRPWSAVLAEASCAVAGPTTV